MVLIELIITIIVSLVLKFQGHGLVSFSFKEKLNSK